MNKGIIVGTLSIIVIWSCDGLDPIADNPLDPNNPNYNQPAVTITMGPLEGEIIDTHSVTLMWKGNELVNHYRFNFDHQDWSDWIESTSITFDYLNEGNHNFSIQSRYESGDTSQIAEVRFIVDAVKGPALMFYPRKQITTQGSLTTLQVWAEEVIDLTAAELSIQFNPSFLDIVSINEGSIFQGIGEVIFLSQYDNDLGILTISTALLGGGNPSINGSGDLAVMEVKILDAGSSTLSFNGTEVFRDPQNNHITILEKIDGIVDSQ